MLDYRIETFIKLCDTMNYRKAAQELNITQPAVTQHIKHIENEYACKLFKYENRVLSKTEQGKVFEKYARGQIYKEERFRESLIVSERKKLRIGATKTIGNYVIRDRIIELVGDENIEFTLLIDNTERLLLELDNNRLDFIVIEGFFDKEKYDYKLVKMEPFVGVCRANHRLANKSVSFEDVFEETLLVREEGSGTRAILEQLLSSRSYTLKKFNRVECLSSFGIIKDAIINYGYITFAYKAFSNSNNGLVSFTINGLEVLREFNIVYLKESGAEENIELLKLIDDK